MVVVVVVLVVVLVLVVVDVVVTGRHTVEEQTPGCIPSWHMDPSDSAGPVKHVPFEQIPIPKHGGGTHLVPRKTPVQLSSGGGVVVVVVVMGKHDPERH